MNAHLNISVSTKLFHTEKDVTYTEICFPRQFNSKCLHNAVHFLFSLNEENTLKFYVSKGYNQMYSAMLLTHRHHICDGCTKEIVNMSAYANSKVFYFARKSLLRKKR